MKQLNTAAFAFLLVIVIIIPACEPNFSHELFLRARPGSMVVAVPVPGPGKSGFLIELEDDTGSLGEIKIDKGLGKKQTLKLDKWEGRFLHITFCAKGEGARWEDFYIAIRPPAYVREPNPAVLEGGRKPNVVVYLIDAMRADSLGCYNDASTSTPRMDEFAESATVYEKAYVTASWTRPSVASLFTGMYAPAHGAIGREGYLDDTLPTMAELLKKEGYHTAGFITNGNVTGKFGFDRGFDIYEFIPENPEGRGVYASSSELLDKIEGQVASLPEPFFIYIHQSDPHAPYTPSKELADKFIPLGATPISGGMEMFRKLVHRGVTPSATQVEYLRGLYDAEVAGADEAFGRFVGILEKRGVYDRTIVALVSDHGEEFYEHKGFGHGGTLYGEQVRVPLVVKYVDSLARKSVNEPVNLADVPATFLDALNVDRPENMAGFNLRYFDRVTSPTPLRSLYFYTSLDKVQKEALLDWPMMLIHNINETNQWGDRTVEWEMYDIVADPSMKSLIGPGEMKMTRKVMKKELGRASKIHSRKGPTRKVELTPEEKKRMEALGYF